MQPDSSHISSVLVLRLGAFGDIVRCFPVMEAIRKHHPAAQITFLTTRPFVSLVKPSPYFDHIWAIDRWRLHQPQKWLAFAHDLRRRGFDCVYDLQRNDRARLMSYCAPRILQKNWFGRKGRGQNAALGTMSPADIPSAENTDLSWIAADTQKFNLPPRYALIVSGSAPQHPYKRWPAEKFASVAQELSTRGITPVLIGTEAERGTINQIKSAAPESIDLCGQTSFVEIGTLARHAAVAIGNDTGPMHMIGIMNCPVVSLFSGVTSPEKSRPAGRYVETLQAQNIADITAGDVLQKTLQMLQSP